MADEQSGSHVEEVVETVAHQMEIPLSEIIVNGLNAREGVTNASVADLVPSIKRMGIIQPILVRPLPETHRRYEAGGRYELVAGERRFKAARIAARSNGNLDGATIPALIKEMDDVEASEAMLVENLKRKELTPLEEARGFAKYIFATAEPDAEMSMQETGERAKELADRIGVSQQFIRRRIHVLGLPDRILAAWDDGEISFPVVEMLMLVPEDTMDNVFDRIREEQERWGQKITAKELRDRLSNASIPMAKARFNQETAGCAGCVHNSETQLQLFDVGMSDDASCSERKCFEAHQIEHLTNVWGRTSAGRAALTNRPVLVNRINANDYEVITADEPDAACLECESFVTLVYLDGDTYIDRVCKGDPECYATKYQVPTDREGQPATPTDDTAAANQRALVRARNIGIEEREELLRGHIPDVLSNDFSYLKDDDDSARSLKLALFSLVIGHGELRRPFAESLRLPEATDDNFYRLDSQRIFQVIGELPPEDVATLLQEMLGKVTLGREVDHELRCQIAGFLGINIVERWRITQAYLEKKSAAQLCELIERHGLMDDELMQRYLSSQLGRGDYRACNKRELVDLIMHFSGLDDIKPAEIRIMPNDMDTLATELGLA